MKIVLLNFVLILLIHPTLNSPSDDSSIRIAAYNPKATEKMFARRMGQEQGNIQDSLRPPRQAQEIRRRRPLSPTRIRPHNTRVVETDHAGETNDDESEAQLIILSPEDLQNPFRGEKNTSDSSFPIGPPVHASTVRSAFGGDPIFSRPPAPPPRPPVPPVLTPSPPPSSLIENGPPTAPPPVLPPSPPPGNRISQVTDIKCFEFGGRQTFDAILTLPDEYEAIPVFQDRPEIDPTTDSYCRMIPTQLVGMFQLIVSNYEKCGVRRCRQSNGEMWNCLILRFPRINGLKLPEDEIIDIRCRPHDKVADSDIQVLRVATAKYADKNGMHADTVGKVLDVSRARIETRLGPHDGLRYLPRPINYWPWFGFHVKLMANKPPTVFEGLQEFECEIGLFRQLPGTQEFNSRVRDEAPLELGEKVQLWSIVKGGDGWRHSRLSEVVIQKEGGSRERSIHNTIVLVFSDGCRNPKYKVIAEAHPFNDPNNKLVNKFTFRAFMFQDMEPGESLLISAKVIGCITKESCEPTICPDDGKLGYGRRRKRRDIGDMKEFQFTTPLSISTSESSFTTEETANSFLKSHVRRENVTDWSRNLAIKIRMPHEPVQQKSVEFGDCKLYLYISLGVSLFFCVLSIGFVSFFLLRKRNKTLNNIPISSPPSTESRRVKRSFDINTSSSGSDTFYSSSDNFSSQSDLRRLPVPSTVKQRKKRVNAELMGLFGNENLMPYASTYPPLLNYYGYMVVPRPQNSHQKKSVRAVKRNARARLSPSIDSDSGEAQGHFQKNTKHQKPFCSCKRKHNDNDILSDAESDCQSSNHTSVIRITTSGSETISQGSSVIRQTPRPRPRITRVDPIYTEIQENIPPTLV